MDHSITGLIYCPSARHAAADTRRPTYESADERDARGSGVLRAAGQAAAAGRGEATERRWTAQITLRHVDHLARSPGRPPHSVGSRASTVCRRGTVCGNRIGHKHNTWNIFRAQISHFSKQGRQGRQGTPLGLGPPKPW